MLNPQIKITISNKKGGGSNNCGNSGDAKKQAVNLKNTGNFLNTPN